MSTALAAAAASVHAAPPRHWFGVFVKTWIAVAPIAAPRAGAVSTPPWMET